MTLSTRMSIRVQREFRARRVLRATFAVLRQAVMHGEVERAMRRVVPPSWRISPSAGCQPSFRQTQDRDMTDMVIELIQHFTLIVMKHIVLPIGLLGLAFAGKAHAETISLDGVSLADAINCRLDARTFRDFAKALRDDQGAAVRRQWRKIDPGSSASLDEYTLPEPLVVKDLYVASRIAIGATSVLAILDVADSEAVGAREGIANAAAAGPLFADLVSADHEAGADNGTDRQFPRFEGERILTDTSEPPAKGERANVRIVVARTVSNMVTHPGKTFFGCAYRIEPFDEEKSP